LKSSINSKLAINGGVPIRSTPWPTYDKGNVILDSDDKKNLIEAFDSNLLFRYDYRDLDRTPVGQFENEAKIFFKSRFALAITSGTTGLILSLLSVGVTSGDYVGVSSYTFSATPSAICAVGAKPLLIEVDENLNIDINDLKEKYNNHNLKALIVVHMRGAVADLEKIRSFCDEVSLPFIEDAVPAMGLKYRGKMVGTWGDVGVFSTQSDKSCNTGEGGLIVTNDINIFSKAVIYSGAYENRYKKHFTGDQLFISDLELPILGYRMDNLRGALGYSQLKKLDLKLLKLDENYNYLINELKDVNEIFLRTSANNEKVLGDSLILRLENEPIDYVSWFTEALHKEGIEAYSSRYPEENNIRFFWNWKFAFPNLSKAQISAIVPQSYRYLNQVVDIPLSPTLNTNDLDDIILAFKKIISKF